MKAILLLHFYLHCYVLNLFQIIKMHGTNIKMILFHHMLK